MILAILLVMTGITACDQTMHPPVVATIDGKKILLDEFQNQAAFMGLGNDSASLTPELREAVLDALVNRHLILNEAKARKIEFDQVKADQRVAMLRGNLSEDDFNNSLGAQGLSYDAWRGILEQELLVKKTIDLVLAGKSQVGADEIRDYYKSHPQEFNRPQQILARHAVFPNEEMAKAFLKKIKTGQDITLMVKNLGGNLPEGGKPAWLGKGYMPEALDKQVFALEKGQVAGPLASTYGFHVLEVLDKKPAKVLSLAQAAKKIQRKLIEAKKQDLVTQWLADLGKKAQIRFDPEFVAKGQTGKNEG